MLRETLVFLALVGASLAALARGPHDPKPKQFEDQEGCYIKELDVVIPFGKSAPSKPPHCLEYRCRKTLVEYATCGVAIARPPCYLVEDRTKPYPECCKKIVCPEQR